MCTSLGCAADAYRDVPSRGALLLSLCALLACSLSKYSDGRIAHTFGVQLLPAVVCDVPVHD
eukprot:1581466-Prymnesium_polylepis.1